MQFTSVIVLAVLSYTATASAIPEAAGNAIAQREAWSRYIGQPCPEKRDAVPEPWCKYIGQPCPKVKRAAEAMAAAIAEPAPEPWCKYIGQPCPKNKRDAEANPEAVCFSESGPCSTAKHTAEALAEGAENTVNML